MTWYQHASPSNKTNKNKWCRKNLLYYMKVEINKEWGI